jgi:hypothetical protein
MSHGPDSFSLSQVIQHVARGAVVSGRAHIPHCPVGVARQQRHALDASRCRAGEEMAVGNPAITWSRSTRVVAAARRRRRLFMDIPSPAHARAMPTTTTAKIAERPRGVVP